MSCSLLSVIIARAGSKGLPSKCMLKINELTVIEYVIKWISALNWKTADNSLIFNKHTIVVSTDIPELRTICKKYNNIIYMQRGVALASDDAKIEDVLYDAYNRVGESYDYISLLYGNMVTRYLELITEPLKFLNSNDNVDAVFSFQNVEKYNPAWMVPITDDLLPKDWKTKGYRRQDLDQLMLPDGHTQIMRTKHFLSFMKDKKYTGTMYEAFGNNIKPWLHDNLIIDIDTKKDYILSNAYIHYMSTKEKK